jgi:hypothetical protein
MQRWEKGLKPGIIKGRWSEEEDRALVYLVSQGYQNWGQVAARMPGRTSKQCRERWNNYLDPTLVHTAFTEEEDKLLLSLHQEHGNKWAMISRQLSGRTENTVKLRFHALQKKPVSDPITTLISSSTLDQPVVTRFGQSHQSYLTSAAYPSAVPSVFSSSSSSFHSSGNTGLLHGGQNMKESPSYLNLLASRVNMNRNEECSDSSYHSSGHDQIHCKVL